MYPLMANKLNEGDNKGFLQYLVKSRLLLLPLLLMPIAAGIIILNKEIVTIVLCKKSI